MNVEPEPHNTGQKTRPAMNLWVIAGILAPVFYVLSIGPITWIESNYDIPEPYYGALVLIYTPLRLANAFGPPWLHNALDVYCSLFRF